MASVTPPRSDPPPPARPTLRLLERPATPGPERPAPALPVPGRLGRWVDRLLAG